MKRTNHDLRDMKSCRFNDVTVTSDFLKIIKAHIIPLLKLKNNKLNEKYNLIAQILACMLEAHKLGKVLADSRDNSSNASHRICLYDALIKARILKVCIGSEISEKVSRYAFTTKGKKIFENLKTSDAIDFLFDTPVTKDKNAYCSDRAPVILRTEKPTSKKKIKKTSKKKITIPFPERMDKYTFEFVERREQHVMRINLANLNHHTWECPIINDKGQSTMMQINPCVRSIFNENFDQGGRLFSRGASGYQSLETAKRLTMLIDGKAIAEVDYSGCQFRMLYHLKKIDFEGDVYMPEKLLPELYMACHSDKFKKKGRSYIKKIANIIINAKSQVAAIGAASKAFRDDNDKTGTLGIIIYKICKTSPKELVCKIKEIHEPINNFFFTGAGLRLQRKESEIIVHVLNRFVNWRLPALSLHDAIICRDEDAELAKRLMEKLYIKEFKFTPILKIDRTY